MKIAKKTIKSFIYIIVIFIALYFSFILGISWQKTQHDNICIDMGGELSYGKDKICFINNSDEKWVETDGVITESSQMPDGSFAYTITYNVKAEGAKNIYGEEIKGEIPQHIFGLNEKVIKGQVVKLKYDKTEPMYYILLDDLKIEN